MKYKDMIIKEGEESFITIVDDEGNEELCQIIFTTENEELGKKYVIFCSVADIERFDEANDSDEQIEVGAAVYIEGKDGAGELQEIESEEEWQFIEEVLQEYDDECCSEEHCHCCEDGTEVCECECDEEEHHHEHCCCHKEGK